MGRPATNWAAAWALTVALWGTLDGGGLCVADEKPAGTPSQSASENASGEQESPAVRRDKQRVAWAAVSLLAGIVVVGIVLLALVMVWGHRVRRIVRTPSPRQMTLDEFWYLRTNKRRELLNRQQARDSADSETPADDTDPS